FGEKTEKRPRKPKEPDTQDDGGEKGSSDTPDADSGSNDPPTGSAPSASKTPLAAPAGESAPPKARGHGRRAAADYHGAETVFCPHDTLQAGHQCPQCKRSRLYNLPSLVRLRFTGQPLALVTRFELARLRCATCGFITVASMPPEASRETYDVSLKVNLALVHYHLGLPFKRIESLQELVGMPLPDATQWELVEQVADSTYPIYEYLKQLGANQPLVYQDDTGARLLSLIRENQADPPPQRTGMHTTVLLFEGEQSICLYFSGRQHAGENLDDILAFRDPDLPPIQWMSDGLSANTPKQHQDQTLEIHCIIHGRRNFVELEAYFPDECTHVIDAIAKVYKNEAHCKKQKLTPQERLAYHQQQSRTVMDELKVWMEKQFEDRCVEPNSRLGGAFNYLLNRWDSLTRFLKIPGAPLDNNSAERALKMIQRIRKNSLFYANEHGAYVGDVITSLIETCRLNGINPLDYLTALVNNRSALFGDPGAWLPWNYRDTLGTEIDPLSHSPPVIDQIDRLGVAVPQ
ncbi:MAG: IS66 family transposase, partial [Gammaproteobacteria bacterium]|nr:IS66 family transposase [Gammaproteobacteria bacterium]